MSGSQDESSGLSKKVDESWKNSVETEKVSEEATPENNLPVSSFSFFVSSLGVEAMIALGQAPHPATNEKKENLSQAKYLIDIIQMLAEKTKGNLIKEEEEILQDLLYHLQMQFVEKSQKL